MVMALGDAPALAQSRQQWGNARRQLQWLQPSPCAALSEGQVHRGTDGALASCHEVQPWVSCTHEPKSLQAGKINPKGSLVS